MALRLLPSIDLRDGKVVRLRQGDYARQIDYDVDPLDVARRYEAAGARWLHVVDLDGARAGAVAQIDLIARVARGTRLRVQAGGGVRERRDIDLLRDAGVERVVVGTRAVEDWPWFQEQASEAAERLVLAIDARDGVVATRAWTASGGVTAIDLARRAEPLGIAALLYTDVARDGMLQGPNLDQTRRLVEATALPVIASGGISSAEDLVALRGVHCWGAIVGRSLYEGTLRIEDALDAAGEQDDTPP